MSARDSLIEIFDAGGPHHLFSAEEVADNILAAHAHELAEKQRAKLIDDGYGPSEDTGDGTCPCGSCSWCLAQDYIDLIDPEVQP